MVNAAYKVDKDLYQDPETKHDITITTTEYTYGGETLAHMRMSRNTSDRISSRINSVLNSGVMLEKEYFIFKDAAGPAKGKTIPQKAFDETKKRFDMSQTVIVCEIVEYYIYTDRNGRKDEAQIVITEENGSATASIDFRDAGHRGDFIGPAWLIP